MSLAQQLEEVKNQLANELNAKQSLEDKISGLESDISAKDERIQSLDTEIEKLKGDIEAAESLLEETRDDLQGKLDAATAKADELEAKEQDIEKRANAKFVAMQTELGSSPPLEDSPREESSDPLAGLTGFERAVKARELEISK